MKRNRRWLTWLTDLGMGGEKEVQIHSSGAILLLAAQFLLQAGAVLQCCVVLSSVRIHTTSVSLTSAQKAV